MRRFTGRTVAVVGAAHSRIERRSSMSLGALTVRTVLEAIADAGLTVADVDGLTTGSHLPSSGGQAIVDGETVVTSNWLAEHLGIHPRFVSGFQGRGQLSGSVQLAAGMVASGLADTVVVHRAMANPPGSYNDNAMTVAHGDDQWRAPFGFWGAPIQIAMLWSEYVQRYKADPDVLAAVAVEARRNGSQLPWSYWYGKPLSREEYLASPTIAGTIRKHDCDIPVDGVGAFVLTTGERARDLPHKPVYVAGFGQGGLRKPGELWSLDQVLDGGRETAAMLWESSGLRLEDIDVPQIYDGFAPISLFWLESLGWCGRGEAAAFVADGGIGPDAPLPFLSGGGALGNGRMHGVPQMLEVYRQLSGRAGERQLAKATAGIACHAYPHFGGVVAYTTEPL